MVIHLPDHTTKRTGVALFRGIAPFSSSLSTKQSGTSAGDSNAMNISRRAGSSGTRKHSSLEERGAQENEESPGTKKVHNLRRSNSSQSLSSALENRNSWYSRATFMLKGATPPDPRRSRHLFSESPMIDDSNSSPSIRSQETASKGQYRLDDIFNSRFNQCDGESLPMLRQRRAETQPIVCYESDDEDEEKVDRAPVLDVGGSLPLMNIQNESLSSVADMYQFDGLFSYRSMDIVPPKNAMTTKMKNQTDENKKVMRNIDEPGTVIEAKNLDLPGFSLKAGLA